MIKELFEIEPTQKNVLIIFIAVTFVSFLQLYIFEPALFADAFVSVGITLGVSICWIILKMPSTFIFSLVLTNANNNPSNVYYDRVVLLTGFSILFWMILLTYLAYELELRYIELIRLTILLSFVKSIFWFLIYSFRKKRKIK